jgi:hypothetical protein
MRSENSFKQIKCNGVALILAKHLVVKLCMDAAFQSSTFTKTLEVEQEPDDSAEA